MRNTILLLIVAGGLCTSCGKNGAGYYSIAPTSPAPTQNNTATHYYYFNNIIIDSNTNYTFNLPGLTEAIFDSGTMAITLRSSIPWLNNWEPFPTYTFPDGSIVTLSRVAEQPGIIVLKAIGPSTPAMNYCFALSNH